MLWSTVLGGAFVETFDNDRFMKVLDNYLSHSDFNPLPVPFATSYQSKINDSLEFVIADSGNVARAVANSANNPFIFPGTSLTHIDPGADREAMTPINDATQHFQPSIIYAINVTGKRAHYTKLKSCKVIEIMVDVPKDFNYDMDNIESTIGYLYDFGYDAVVSKLTRE